MKDIEMIMERMEKIREMIVGENKKMGNIVILDSCTSFTL